MGNKKFRLYVQLCYYCPHNKLHKKVNSKHHTQSAPKLPVFNKKSMPQKGYVNVGLVEYAMNRRDRQETKKTTELRILLKC